MGEFKRKVDLAVEVIESCFDENNPKDNLSFDERLQKKIDDCEDEVVRGILNNAKNFWIKWNHLIPFFNIGNRSYVCEQTNLFIQEFENTLYSINLLYEYKVSRFGMAN